MKIKRKNSLRLKGYDYSLSGAYFITIHLQDQKIILGDIKDNSVILNIAGDMIEKWWLEIPNKFKTVILDEYKIMPTHFHGIVMLNNDPFWSEKKIAETAQNSQPNNFVGADLCVRPDIKEIMQWFKTISTNYYIKGVKENIFKRFYKKLWQRSFYDRVIRNEKELEFIRNYIYYNPIKWTWDKEDFENRLRDYNKVVIKNQNNSKK